MADGSIAVVGLLGGVPYGAGAEAALAAADVVVGSPRQLEETVVPPGAELVLLRGPLDDVLATVDERSSLGARVCVLASGDPGFFGIVRALGARIGPGRFAVHPAPSSVAMAFARLGLPWDDATVVSAHGRSLADAVAAIVAAGAAAPAGVAGAVGGAGAKVAVLTAPDTPPEALGRALLAAPLDRPDAWSVAVVAHIGGPDEQLLRTDLPGLAAGRFSPMAVVVLLGAAPSPAASTASLTWSAGGARGGPAFGRPEEAFDHRDGMITKAEVRAVALAKLALPATGVLWDVGAGSGSVGVECAALAPGLTVLAIERDPAQAERVRANARAHGATVTVVEGEAPDALAGLPDPDRVFVGGGGIDVLDAAVARLRTGGTVVATYAIVERALAARERLGAMVQLSVARAAPIGVLGVRLVPENPVFLCWGPSSRA
ncbi:MAG TPA: precorrin-6y C5,15-methyltransferase (decarboxylating) subunit CbiE [Acidimicrobiales bacterium]|nr:precorrin-6y C5,15-methyltransferase (decarboxylating) subunit CbiE [Acidimicrobiales bacterium]